MVDFKDEKPITVEFNEADFKTRNRELGFLLEMSNFLASSTSLDALLNGALAKILDFFHLDAGRIYLMDPDRQFLLLAVHHGIEPKGLRRISITEGFSGKAARTQSFIAQPVSSLENKKRADLLLAKGLKFIVCVPLIIHEQVEGVMNLAARKMINVDPPKIDLMTALGNQIAVAVNNATLREDLENKIENLYQKKQMIKFFAYSISHDLKSPAISIHGLTKRLHEKSSGLLDDKGREYCRRIMDTAEHMLALVEKINAYIITTEASFHYENVAVKEIADIIRNEFASALSDRRIKWSEPEALPMVVADKVALLRVFRNLVDNALKYGGDRLHRLSLGYSETESHHILSLSDDGVGIPEQNREAIFNHFQRDLRSRGIAGSGLGLAIVKETAERHGGSAWAIGNNGHGVTLSISVSKEIELSDLSEDRGETPGPDKGSVLTPEGRREGWGT